jgi:hypothetical protein
MTSAKLGGEMYFFDPSECIGILLDLICYEMHCGRLSPEMKLMLENHLATCPSCRKGIRDFMQILAHASSLKDEQILS